MQRWSRTRSRLLTLRGALDAALRPERAGDAATRRAFADEARETNGATVRWMVFLLVPLHGAIVANFSILLAREVDPARIAWMVWLIVINAVLGGAGIVGGIVAHRRSPGAFYRVLGDVGGALYILGGAAMTANVQRANPNLNVFLITLFFTTFRLRIRPSVYLLVLAGGVALVLAGMAHLRPEGATRAADDFTVFSAASISLGAFFLTRGLRFREIEARRKVEHLNAQLNQQIRERSQELARALARLVDGHRAIEPGTVLGGRVEIDAPLGRGGMGAVYRGRDRVTGLAVAVKVVQADTKQALDSLYRFLQEAQILASVAHRAIVRSIHVDVSEDGRLFQILELVEGETLAARLSRGDPLPSLVVARLGSVLADALAAAHQAGVVHCDVKPSNVILTRAAPGLKLLDFGISTLRSTHDRPESTGRWIVGTPEFLSPEQVHDPSNVGDRTDVYSLGLVLYLAVAGRLPYAVENPAAWGVAHVLHTPVELGSIARSVDPGLARIIMACLRKDPRERPSAATVAAELAAVADRAEVPALEALDLLAAKSTGPRRRALDDGAPITARSEVVGVMPEVSGIVE